MSPEQIVDVLTTGGLVAGAIALISISPWMGGVWLAASLIYSSIHR